MKKPSASSGPPHDGADLLQQPTTLRPSLPRPGNHRRPASRPRPTACRESDWEAVLREVLTVSPEYLLFQVCLELWYAWSLRPWRKTTPPAGNIPAP